jgi:phosphatidate cytidylyltransferase
MGKAKGYAVQQLLSTGLLWLLLSSFFWPPVSLQMAVFAVVLLIPAASVLARSEIADALPASAISIASILYIGMLGGAIIALRLDFPPVGASLVFFLFIVVWAGDAGAYYVGRRFGKHPLSPLISPKKTIEGLLGGMVASAVGAAIVHFTFFPEFPLLYAMIAAPFLSASGVVGDLAESMWKRSAAVKDSGHVFPGHGGVFDRFDSILFAAPVLFAYWTLLTRYLKVASA